MEVYGSLGPLHLPVPYYLTAIKTPTVVSL